MKLIDKDVLVAEIKKHQAIWDGMDDDYCKGQRLAYSDVISFLDTLEVKEVGVDFGDPQGDIGVKWVQEEPASNDLEEAADKHLVEKGYLLTTKNGEHLAEVEAKGLFKAGAQWQKEQLMENAVEAVIHPYDGEIWVDKDLLSIYDDCQRVKLIIIKEK